MKRLIIMLFLFLLLLPITVFAAEDNLYPTLYEENSKWGYTDDSGQWVIPASFDWAQGFRGDYACVSVYPNGINPTESGEDRPYQGIINPIIFV